MTSARRTSAGECAAVYSAYFATFMLCQVQGVKLMGLWIESLEFLLDIDYPGPKIKCEGY